MARGCLPDLWTQSARRSPSATVISASTSSASRSPDISVEVLAGQVAGVLPSHRGPPGTGLYPLLKTLTDSELVITTPSHSEVSRQANRPLAHANSTLSPI